MTVSTTTAKSGPYAGSGTTGPFTVGFRFLENSHILVVKNVAGVETNLVLDTDYTVTGAGASSGSVTLATALATGQTLTIVRNVPTTQETDYVAGDSFPAESHERALDQLTMIAQQLKEEVDRSAKLPVSSTADADALVADIVRLADSADEVDAVAGIEASVVTVAGIDSEVATVAGIAANVTTVAGVSTNVTTVAGISSNVTTVAGVAANVTTVAGVSSSVTTVAGISAAVSTVAADGTDIGAVAAISADVQAVADIATDVSAVENIAANVTTVAGIAANVTTVAGIAANVTAVAGNATNINAVAANETNIDAVAGNATNINAVAADATDIGVVATNIAAVSTVATDIASVNSAAANMAAILDAPAQASAAAASAAAAAASLDNFDDRYLGSKASAPTLDNDGNALVAGALYFNNGTVVSDDKGMWVYDGGTWIAASAASQAILVKYKYVATAGQTSFSGTDANGLTLSYTAGSIIVTLNGVVMDAADYTATTGSTVVLGTAAALNDELGVFAFSTFDIANTYTQAQVDAFAVKLTGDQTVAGVKTFSGATTVMNGNVGIGTSSPSYKLHVQSTLDPVIGVQATTAGYPLGFMQSGNGAVYVGATGAYPYTFYTNGTERARIDSSGNLLVGTTSSVLSGKLTVKGTNATISSDGLSTSAQLNIQAHNGAGYDPKIYLECPGVQGAGMYLNRATGQLRLWSTSDAAGVSLAGGGTSWGSFSDERLKDIIEPIENATEKVCSLRTVIGKYKTDAPEKRRVFLIAQDVKAVLPEAVYQNSDEDDTLSLAYTDVIPLLTAAIQEQQALITTLTERITALENK